MIQISRSGHFKARKENGNEVEGQISKDMLDALFDLIESTQAPEELLAEILTANTTPEQALRLRTYHPVWMPGEDLAVGDRRRRDLGGAVKLYEVIQAHTSQADWPPETVPALFRDLEGHVVTDPEGGETEEIPDFAQPTGAHDAYAIGALVRFEGRIYRNKIKYNAHSPAAYPAGWELVEEIGG